MSKAILNMAICCSFLAISTGCVQTNSHEGEYIAIVGDNKLMHGDIEGIAMGSQSPEDSLLILGAYVQNWIKDQLLIREAEKSMPEDFNIEKLVQDYRSSLILANYIEKVIERELDTVVTAQEIDEYYIENKQQYALLEPILKYFFVKINKERKGVSELEKKWDKITRDEIVSFCESHICEYVQIDDKFWSPDNELGSIVPSKMMAGITWKDKLSFVKSDDEYKYFVKVLGYVGKGDVPPLEFIEGKIVSVILNNRKQELLKRKKQVLLDKYNNTANVTSFVGELAPVQTK